MMSEQHSNFIPPYINGKFFPISKPERLFPINNPLNPKDILAHAAWNKDLIDPIFSGLKSAQKKMSDCPPEERMNYIMKFIGFLRENKDEIKSNMVLELARSHVAVEEEWNLCEKLFAALPEFCRKELSTKKYGHDGEWYFAPLGLVLISSNIALPVYSLLCGALPALAAGNVVCLRPSSHCFLSGSLLASGFHQASFPAGAVQIVYGDFDVFRKLVLSHQFDVILHAGVEEQLEQIRHDTAHQQNIRLVLNTGGKNAAYVTESADIEKAIEKMVYGMCVDAGQRLESTSLGFVNSKIFDQFQDQFVDAIKKMPIAANKTREKGHAEIHTTHPSQIHTMGPICSSNSWERYLRFQGIAARECNETLRWGKPIDNLDNGYFVSPGVHVLKPEKVLKSIYATSAFFGPDLCLIPIDDMQEMLPILEGLSNIRCLGVHSKYPEEAHTVRRISRIPSLIWNNPTTTLNPLLPCSGNGNAGNSSVIGAHFFFSTVTPQCLYGLKMEEKPKEKSV